jgi:hypothetical protein
VTPLRHLRVVLRLVPVVCRLWWYDVREPGAALRVLRVVVARSPERTAILRAHVTHGAVASWCLAWAAILWGGATLPGAIVAALAGVYSLIALTVRDRLEAL